MDKDQKRITIEDRICAFLKEGMLKKDAARMAGIGETTFYRWVDEDENFKSKVAYAISWRIKQPKYKLKLPNSEGKGGFNDNPDNINQHGRPKVTTLARLMEEAGKEIGFDDEYALKYKVAKRLWELAINGDIYAARIIFDLTEGKVK